MLGLHHAASCHMPDAWASAPDVGMHVSDDGLRYVDSRRSQPGAGHQQRVLCAGGQRGADGAGAGQLHANPRLSGAPVSRGGRYPVSLTYYKLAAWHMVLMKSHFRGFLLLGVPALQSMSHASASHTR